MINIAIFNELGYLLRPCLTKFALCRAYLPVTLNNYAEYDWKKKDVELVLDTLSPSIQSIDAALVWGKKGSKRIGIINSSDYRILAVIMPVAESHSWRVIEKMDSLNNKMTYKSLKTALGQVKRGLDAIARENSLMRRKKYLKMRGEQRFFEHFLGHNVLRVDEKAASVRDMDDDYILTPDDSRIYSDKILDSVETHDAKSNTDTSKPIQNDLRDCKTVGDFRDIIMKYDLQLV